MLRTHFHSNNGREDDDLRGSGVIYFGFNGKIGFCLPVVLLVSPFGFGWILESCFSVDDFALRFSSLVSTFHARDFPYCLGLPLKHIALAFFCYSSTRGAGPSFGALTPGFGSLLPSIWAS
jgi:hypothetical protein